MTDTAQRLGPHIGLVGLAAAGLAAPAVAQTAEISVTIPQLKQAEYHRPYIAIWLETPGDEAMRTLAVWYDYDNRENGGTKWLRDLRSWWRAGGRDTDKPADAVTGATRAPGPQKAQFDVKDLKPGDYTIHVEASREEGGREELKLPFKWAGKSVSAKAAGKEELGAVTLTVKP